MNLKFKIFQGTSNYEVSIPDVIIIRAIHKYVKALPGIKSVSLCKFHSFKFSAESQDAGENAINAITSNIFEIIEDGKKTLKTFSKFIVLCTAAIIGLVALFEAFGAYYFERDIYTALLWLGIGAVVAAVNIHAYQKISEA